MKPKSIIDQEVSKILGRPNSNESSPIKEQNILSSRLSLSGFTSPRARNPFEKKKYVKYKLNLLDKD